jgi:uroporphyrinogen-III synthase
MASAAALANIGVAITRPLEQAQTLTQLIQDAGGTVISFPLIAISALNDYSQFNRVIADIQHYDWLIFISSNAVENGMPRLFKQGLPQHLRFAAIGPVTAQKLAEFGIEETLIPQGKFDSESLLSLPEMHAMQGKKVMIVRGVGGREVLAETLKARGAEVSFAECYQRINPQHNCEVLAQAYANKQLHSIVVTSSEAMRYLLDLAGNSVWLKQVTLCVNHARIAELPLSMGFKTVIAEAPGDAAMLNLLLRTHTKS